MIEFLNTGLDFNSLFVLQNLSHLPQHIKVQGWVNLLKAKGLLDEGGDITEEGIRMVELAVGRKTPAVVEEKASPFPEFVKALHLKLQNLLLEKIGRKQMKLYGNHAFLCGPKDLETKLKGAINKYKLQDLERVEKVLISYVNSCISCNFEKVQLVEYYISKNGISKMCADYEEFEEEDMVVEKKMVSKKDLF